MARVQVLADDGWVALDELATPHQLDSEHYRRCLADRIHWAVGDAQRRATESAAWPDASPVAVAEPTLVAA